jgi:hypothetical protein
MVIQVTLPDQTVEAPRDQRCRENMGSK